jgi:hypothetical protein
MVKELDLKVSEIHVSNSNPNPGCSQYYVFIHAIEERTLINIDVQICDWVASFTDFDGTILAGEALRTVLNEEL